MTIVLNIVCSIAGIGLLYAGGNYLVKGSSALALKLNIPPIIIGLTIVAFGTSAPELFVSLLSAFQGSPGISLGNIVGSNIINIALILGLSSCILSIPISQGIIRRDMPMMFISYGILLMASIPLPWENLDPGTGKLFRLEGLIMMIVLTAYIFFLYQYSKNHKISEIIDTDAFDTEDTVRPLSFFLFFIALGITALAFGSDLLIRGASWLARNIFNASDRFIGVSIIALGTSLPELITSVIAALRKQMDISVGNIIGSNIFNSLLVLGLTGFLKPLNIAFSDFIIDICVMIGVSLTLLLLAVFRKKLELRNGILFLFIYGIYFFYLLRTRTM
ncbi:MAG: calcium/sodium antiporter [Salinispira sp.]